MQPLSKPHVLALLLLASTLAASTLAACADRRKEGGGTWRGLLDVAYFTDWDADGDTYLSEGELAEGIGSLPLWEGWDTDGDGSLSEGEFEAAFAGEDWYVRGLHGIWDGDDDGRLSEGEWTGGLYDEWDLDGDGLEWGEFDVDGLD